MASGLGIDSFLNGLILGHILSSGYRIQSILDFYPSYTGNQASVDSALSFLAFHVGGTVSTIMNLLCYMSYSENNENRMYDKVNRIRTWFLWLSLLLWLAGHLTLGYAYTTESSWTGVGNNVTTPALEAQLEQNRMIFFYLVSVFGGYFFWGTFGMLLSNYQNGKDDSVSSMMIDAIATPGFALLLNICFTTILAPQGGYLYAYRITALVAIPMVFLRMVTVPEEFREKGAPDHRVQPRIEDLDSVKYETNPVLGKNLPQGTSSRKAFLSQRLNTIGEVSDNEEQDENMSDGGGEGGDGKPFLPRVEPKIDLRAYHLGNGNQASKKDPQASQPKGRMSIFSRLKAKTEEKREENSPYQSYISDACWHGIVVLLHTTFIFAPAVSIPSKLDDTLDFHALNLIFGGMLGGSIVGTFFASYRQTESNDNEDSVIRYIRFHDMLSIASTVAILLLFVFWGELVDNYVAFSITYGIALGVLVSNLISQGARKSQRISMAWWTSMCCAASMVGTGISVALVDEVEWIVGTQAPAAAIGLAGAAIATSAFEYMLYVSQRTI